ncbi:hypothetical protein [Burkholderia sp. IMCC1007]|uniref:hypothetical protein n=1 Tax=Burkholderia sp. IMCC1007 TaxID=3004104 RepID=UPI0022B3E141|nr:hypothetical protein [Burkholderia sp. IMCC1007]
MEIKSSIFFAIACCIALFFLSLPCFAYKSCGSGEVKTIQMEASKGEMSKVDVRFCPGGEVGHVSVSMFTGKNKQQYRFDVDNQAYSVSIDPEVDLKHGGGRSVGISNGRGRSGDGMWYWIFDKKTKLFKYAGEAPRLQSSKTKSGTFFAIESGSGEVQSTRYNYRLKNDRLTMVGAIKFIPVEEEYEISVMTCSSDLRCWEVKRLKNVSEERVQRCMNGTDDCEKS